MEKHDIICLMCPLTCRITLIIEKGKVVNITGAKCKKGEGYALQEYKSPKRILTATVKTTDKNEPLLPVRTTTPIQKNLLLRCMEMLAEKEVRQPVKIGQVIVENIMDTGIDVVATRDFP